MSSLIGWLGRSLMASCGAAPVPANARGEGHRCKGLGSPSCCGRGERAMGARALPARHHEFPNRLQHHDYLPGEPRLLPGPPASLFRPQSRLLAAQRCGLAGVSPPAPPRRCAELGEGWGFAASGCPPLLSGGGLRQSHPTQPPATLPARPPTPHFPVLFWTGSGGLTEKGAVPETPDCAPDP